MEDLTAMLTNENGNGMRIRENDFANFEVVNQYGQVVATAYAPHLLLPLLGEGRLNEFDDWAFNDWASRFEKEIGLERE